MKFVAMTELREHHPTIEIGNGTYRFDLHNDATLENIEISRSDKAVAIRWTLRHAQWAQKGEGTSARVILRCGDAQYCLISPQLALRNKLALPELDFIEYARLPDSFGQLRFVLDDSSEICVVARSCELRVLKEA
jgi:hypothetical protein